MIGIGDPIHVSDICIVEVNGPKFLLNQVHWKLLVSGKATKVELRCLDKDTDNKIGDKALQF